MKVKDVMGGHPAVCGPEEKLDDLARIMVEHGSGAVPVVRDLDGRKDLIGIITDRDVVCRSLAEGKDPLSITVKDCMSQPVVTAKSTDDVDVARRLMEENLIQRLPVLDEEGVVCGVISLENIRRRLSTGSSGDVLHKISQPAG